MAKLHPMGLDNGKFILMYDGCFVTDTVAFFDFGVDRQAFIQVLNERFKAERVIREALPIFESREIVNNIIEWLESSKVMKELSE